MCDDAPEPGPGPGPGPGHGARDGAGRGHRPVLAAELLEGLNVDAHGCYVDATYGRGGHSAALLRRLDADGCIIAFDKDAEACRHARATFGADARFSIRHDSFAALRTLADDGLERKIAGVLFDLGVSSAQLEAPERGFSFLRDGPLDMRMDVRRGASAAQWLNAAAENEIARVLRDYGEERAARRIAAAIVKRRPLRTTGELAALIERVLGRRRGKHPATRSFLAVRLFINRELEELGIALRAVPRVLRGGGRLAVITFHSLEDRIVKRFIRSQCEPRRAPRGLPVPDDDGAVTMKRVGRPIVAGAAEVAANPRARSARLRLARRLA